jgi:hypothetical protein
MLANVWYAMNDAIPQIAAQEWLDQFTVMTVANPYVEQEARENILASWRNAIGGAFKVLTGGTSGKSTKSRQEYVDGLPLYRQAGLPLKEVHRIVSQAFGREVKVE